MQLQNRPSQKETGGYRRTMMVLQVPDPSWATGVGLTNFCATTLVPQCEKGDPIVLKTGARDSRDYDRSELTSTQTNQCVYQGPTQTKTKPVANTSSLGPA